MSIRLVLADDEAMVRSGLRLILDAEPDIDVVGEAQDGVSALEVTRRRCPDVLLMDIRMPGLDGIAAAERLIEEDARTRVLLLTTFDHDDYLSGRCGRARAASCSNPRPPRSSCARSGPSRPATR
jgi:YesN/AraC family two-component response regulator